MTGQKLQKSLLYRSFSALKKRGLVNLAIASSFCDITGGTSIKYESCKVLYSLYTVVKTKAKSGLLVKS